MATYKTEVHNGTTYRVKHWTEVWKDEDTGESLKIKRKMPVKRDGVRCNCFGNHTKVITK